MKKEDLNSRSTAAEPPDPADSSSDNSKKVWLVELVGGAIVVVVLFVVHRFRPSRHEAPDGATTTDVIERSTGPQLGSSAASSVSRIDPSDSPIGYASTYSIWPLVVAAGITLSAFGIVTNVTFSIAGIAVFVVGVIGWAGELIRE